MKPFNGFGFEFGTYSSCHWDRSRILTLFIFMALYWSYIVNVLLKIGISIFIFRVSTRRPLVWIRIKEKWLNLFIAIVFAEYKIINWKGNFNQSHYLWVFSQIFLFFLIIIENFEKLRNVIEHLLVKSVVNNTWP